MFRFLVLAIFALFAALAVVGVERSTLVATERAAARLEAPTPDDPAHMALVLHSVPVLEQPIRRARVMGHLRRGDTVLVKRSSAGGWTQAQSAAGALGFVPSYALSGPGNALSAAVY